MSWLQRLRHRARRVYRVHVVEEESLEDRAHLRLKLGDVWISITLAVVLVMGLTVLVLAVTPAKEWLPGYPDMAALEKERNLSQRVRQLQHRIAQQDSFINSIKRTAGFGESDSLIQSHQQNGTPQAQAAERRPAAKDKDTAPPSEQPPEESPPPAEAEPSNDAAQPAAQPKLSTAGNGALLLNLLQPVEGELTRRYAPSKGHYAIDLATPPGSIVKAAAAGHVIFADYTMETGYVIGLSHRGEYLTFYKHNSQLMKSVGDYVFAGEGIAASGNSGENSSGPHLHFELWHNGQPVDPLLYLDYGR